MELISQDTANTANDLSPGSQSSIIYSTHDLKHLGSSTISRTNDDIHNTITLDPVTLALVDSPQFQRLRGLGQLGVASFVYINATHTRFEHSLGVAHLAATLTRNLQRKQPQLNISEKDILCVKLAGLCHDLGHGPFSHIYDGELRRQMKREAHRAPTGAPLPSYDDVSTPPRLRAPPPPPASTLGEDQSEFMAKWGNWAHEDASLTMLDALLAHHGLAIDLENLDEPLAQIGDGINALSFGIFEHTDAGKQVSSGNVLTSRDLCFIKECIHAEPLHGNKDMIGRPVHMEFLYDIVSNRHSGLDVDKMDYYARDQKRTLGTGQVDFMLIEEAFVALGECPKPSECWRCKHNKNELPGRHYMLSWPEKLVVKAMEFFKTRFSMHSNVYMHKTVKAIEYMVCDALIKADPYLPVPDGKGSYTRMSQAMADAGAYVHLKDSVLDMIECSSLDCEPMQEAKEIVRRIRRRELYKCVLAIGADGIPLWDLTDEEITNEICAVSEKVVRQNLSRQGVDENDSTFRTRVREQLLTPGDLIVEKRQIHHGMADKNPVDLMRFVGKQELHKLSSVASELPVAERMQEKVYESHIPRKFMERKIRIYARHHNKGVLLLSAAKEVMKMSMYKNKADSPISPRGGRIASTVCLSPAPNKRQSRRSRSQSQSSLSQSQSQSSPEKGENEGALMFSQDSNFEEEDEEEEKTGGGKRGGDEQLSQGSKKRALF